MTLIDADASVVPSRGVSLAEPGDYVALLKPRVMSLVMLTAVTGFMVAPGHIHPLLGAVAMLCIAIGAGASGALNMWYDADIDRLMARTAKRPIPLGRIERREALAFGLTLSVFSVVVLGLTVNLVAAGLLAFTIFFYAVIYTMLLKRTTPQNIVIGGAAGAFPPMVGWACSTGTISIESITLFMIIFLWTPPHFWALALFKLKDYGSAGVPMMPNVAGEASTKRQIFAYSLILAPVGVAPYVLGFAGPVYGVASAILGLIFVLHAYRTLKMPDGDVKMVAAKKLFGFSIVYLFTLFALLLGEAVVARAWTMVGA